MEIVHVSGRLSVSASPVGEGVGEGVGVRDQVLNRGINRIGLERFQKGRQARRQGQRC